MKLTKEHIGKKMRDFRWRDHAFFIPLAQASDGVWLGKDNNGRPNIYTESCESWEFFNEQESPKQEIKLWSVWGGHGGGVLIFLIKIKEHTVFFYNPEECHTSNMSLRIFEEYYGPRPDLEVVAPVLSIEGSYITMSKILYSQKALDWGFYKWPASLALCQIVEKKK